MIITQALAGERVPIYGTGTNVRDWLYVEDHCDALALVFESGRNGRTYGIGAGAEVTNLELAGMVLDRVDAATGNPPGTSRELIELVADRPGHDFRYAMDTTRIAGELGWSAATPLDAGLDRTVRWYLEHPAWVAEVGEG